MASPARDFGLQGVHYLRRTLDVAQVPSGTVYEIGTIPAGAMMLSSGSGIYFTSGDFSGGGTTNSLAVGFAADAVSSANSTALHNVANQLLTTGVTYYLAFGAIATAALARPVTVDRTYTAVWTGGATTGVVDLVIAYMPKR